MGELKIKKIGDEVVSVFPEEWGLQEGDVLHYSVDKNMIVLDAGDIARAHDRKLIEQGFDDIKNGNFLTEEEMNEKYSKYGWGE
jgi:hypothetical protein